MDGWMKVREVGNGGMRKKRKEDAGMTFLHVLLRWWLSVHVIVWRRGGWACNTHRAGHALVLVLVLALVLVFDLCAGGAAQARFGARLLFPTQSHDLNCQRRHRRQLIVLQGSRRNLREPIHRFLRRTGRVNDR